MTVSNQIKFVNFQKTNKKRETKNYAYPSCDTGLATLVDESKIIQDFLKIPATMAHIAAKSSATNKMVQILLPTFVFPLSK